MQHTWRRQAAVYGSRRHMTASRYAYAGPGGIACRPRCSVCQQAGRRPQHHPGLHQRHCACCRLALPCRVRVGTCAEADGWSLALKGPLDAELRRRGDGGNKSELRRHRRLPLLFPMRCQMLLLCRDDYQDMVLFWHMSSSICWSPVRLARASSAGWEETVARV